MFVFSFAVAKLLLFFELNKFFIDFFIFSHNKRSIYCTAANAI